VIYGGPPFPSEVLEPNFRSEQEGWKRRILVAPFQRKRSHASWQLETTWKPVKPLRRKRSTEITRFHTFTTPSDPLRRNRF